MPLFALIGVGGYIAPRHLNAIKKTGNTLIAALDTKDSVGILDSYFPEAKFFVEFERFDRYLDMLRRKHGRAVNYISICSPNYLHDAHCRFALRLGAHAICEKPLVLNPWNVDALAELEQEYGKKINTIMQLRLHPAIISLKKQIDESSRHHVYDVVLTYITARGPWYLVSWKGDIQKSGGIATNIGIHFFDMLLWIFGAVKANIVHCHQPTMAAGYLELEKARVRWFLSINRNDLPSEILSKGSSTFRSIQIDGKEIEFSDGFGDLHIRSYEEILNGKGFGINDVKPSIDLVSYIRNAKTDLSLGVRHPFLHERIISI